MSLQAGILSFIASFTLSTSSLVYIVSPFSETTSQSIPPLSPLAEEIHSINTPSPLPSISPSPVISPTPDPTLFPSFLPTIVLSPKPIPTPSPSVQPATATQLDEWLTKYANEFHVERGLLHNIALCESKMNQFARNGDYGGLYQFASNTWKNARKAMNQDTDSNLRFDAEQSIKTAAFKISQTGPGSWVNCTK